MTESAACSDRVGVSRIEELVLMGSNRETHRRWRMTVVIWVERAVLLATIVALWQVADAQNWVNAVYMASPLETGKALFGLLSEHLFWHDLIVTLREAVFGWAIGSAAGLAFGLFLGSSDHALKVFGPFLTFFNAVPKIALAPIIILWFGIGEPSKVVLSVLVVFFIVQVPTTAAVGLVDRDLNTVLLTMGASSLQRFRRVYLPGILPALFGALRLAAVFSLLSVVFGEYIASKRGLGQRLFASTSNFDMAQAFSIMIILAFLALALNALIGMSEARALRWQGKGGRGAVVSI